MHEYEYISCYVTYSLAITKKEKKDIIFTISLTMVNDLLFNGLKPDKAEFRMCQLTLFIL